MITAGHHIYIFTSTCPGLFMRVCVRTAQPLGKGETLKHFNRFHRIQIFFGRSGEALHSVLKQRRVQEGERSNRLSSSRQPNETKTDNVQTCSSSIDFSRLSGSETLRRLLSASQWASTHSVVKPGSYSCSSVRPSKPKWDKWSEMQRHHLSIRQRELRRAKSFFYSSVNYK